MVKNSIKIDEIVPTNYFLYGSYVNTEKMIPFIYDGLLPVQRRILYGTYLEARQKAVKTKNVIGVVTGRFHPHNLDKKPFEWAVHNNFIEGFGSWGCSIGKNETESANERYTNIKMSKETEEIAFKLIKHTDFRMSELDYEEPVFLPTMFPFCLMCEEEYPYPPAVGFKTRIPCYEKKDLWKRLNYLLGNSKKCTIKPKYKNCTILSGNAKLETLLATGDAKIHIQGNYDIDETNMVIKVYGWSPKYKYATLHNKIDNYKKWGLFSNELAGSNDDSADGKTIIRFEVLKRINKEDIWNKLKEAITESLKDTINYSVIVVKNNKVELVSIDEMLLTAYNKYKEIFERYLKFTIDNIQNNIKEIDDIEKIKPFISDATKEKSENLIYKKLNNLSGVSIERIKEICSKYRISKLISISTDKKDLLISEKEYKQKLNNIVYELELLYKNI